MYREPTAADVKAAFEQYGGSFDFTEKPLWSAPLNFGMKSVDIVMPKHDDMPERPAFVDFSLEIVGVNGERHIRAVGSVPGTDLQRIPVTGWWVKS